MSPKEIADRIENAAKPDQFSMHGYIDAVNPSHMLTLLADYRKQSELLEEARTAAEKIMDPAQYGVGGIESAENHVEFSYGVLRALLAKLEAGR